MQPDPGHSYENAMAQMRDNCARDLPWFVGSDVGKASQFVIVAGGPSMKSRVGQIRKRQKDGACVLACNGAVKFLLENGVKPDICAFLDISPVVAGFIPEVEPGMLYLVASVVHPSTLDALEGRHVVLWHCDYGDGRTKDQAEILKAFPKKPGSLIGGGNTIGMRAPHLGYLSGFRQIHFYGIDSSYSEDGADHAYIKHDGPELETVTVKFHGKDYICAPWMAKQAQEFEFYCRQFASLGAQFIVHGTGLIPDLWRAIRTEKKEAA
jgi:hypothetical protein